MPRRGLYMSQMGIEPSLEPEEGLLEPEEVDGDVEEVVAYMYLPYLICDEVFAEFGGPLRAGGTRRVGRRPRGTGPGDVLRPLRPDRSTTHRDVPYLRELPRTKGEDTSAKDAEGAYKKEGKD